MVVGIGVDIVDIPRQALTAHGERFCRRVFTAGEIAYCEQFTNRAERYAARFAAKEAARKALGAATPLKWLAWREVEIISSTAGAPQLQFHGCAAVLLPAAAHHARVSGYRTPRSKLLLLLFWRPSKFYVSIRLLLRAAYCSCRKDGVEIAPNDGKAANLSAPGCTWPKENGKSSTASRRLCCS